MHQQSQQIVWQKHTKCIFFQVGEPDSKHMDRMFYALETFCENLDEDIVPYLPTLMVR